MREDAASVSPELAEKIRNNLSLFKLNEVYQYHKTDVKDLLRKKYLYSGAYGRKLEEMMHGLPGMTEEEKNRLRYGTSLKRENFRKELLGKMTYDVVGSLDGER